MEIRSCNLLFLILVYLGTVICRRSVLEKKLASSDVPEEEQINLLKDLERKETEYIRLKRHKISVNDFDILTIIGRGAFGEVRYIYNFLSEMSKYVVFILRSDICSYSVP